MSLSRSPFGVASRMMLRCASLLVPANQKASWLKEWRSELWYARGNDQTQRMSFYMREQRAVSFCLGAFQDAWYLRCEQRSTALRPVKPSQSAVQCIAILSLLVFVSFTVSRLLSNVRAATSRSLYQEPNSLVLISPSGVSMSALPQIRVGQFRFWQKRSQRLFSEFAFYQPAVKPMRIASHYTTELNIATASGNLFSMLGVQPLQVVENAGHLPVVVVSEDVWKYRFRSDSRLLGSIVEIGIHKAVLGGVISKERWRLPGKFDAWLLEPGVGAPAISETARGFVVARLGVSANKNLGGKWRMVAPQADGELDNYECVALSAMDGATMGIYVFTVLLALLTLPAITSFYLGDYPAGSDQVSWPLRLRRWIFLLIKIGLLLSAIYFSSLDLAYGFAVGSLAAEYIQIVASFLMSLIGFRWVLEDQRRRCPSCLCTLINPARVGEPSRNFLSWNGTELICAGGHGLLHVPELPTSWFATQRWLYLDSSWSGLFVGTFKRLHC